MSGTPASPDSAAVTGAVRPGAETAASAVVGALRDPASHARLWLTAAAGLALDLASKHWAFTTLRQTERRVLVPHVLEFQTTLNPGALFGIGAGHTEVFLIASVIALGLVLWMFAQTPRRWWFMHIALGAILAGALGNMYDRVTVQVVQYPGSGRFYERQTSDDGQLVVLREYPASPASDVRTLPRWAADEIGPADGHVRDFIKIPTRWFGGRDVWPWVFNVADMLLVGGVGVLALRMLRDRPARAAGESPATPADRA